MELTSEVVPHVLVICSWRNTGLLSQPAIHQIQHLILEFSLFFFTDRQGSWTRLKDAIIRDGV